MRTSEISGPRLRAMIIPPLACLLLFACSVNVKKEANGHDKQVDIKTPVGGIHVGKEADASDVGVDVYPGARPKAEDADGADKSANVNISGFGYGVKVVALSYESDDSPEKLLAFYKNQLKKYGSVLECHSAEHVDLNTNFDHKAGQDSHTLDCGTNSGKNVELKAGTRENQHVVAVEPDGKGSSFSLIYVRLHDKQADI
jgi:hypothetical protein